MKKKNKILSKIIISMGSIIAFFGINLIGMPGPPFVLIISCGIGYVIIQIISLYLIKKTKEIDKKYYKKYYKKNNRYFIEILQTEDPDERCEKIANFLEYIIKNNNTHKNKYNKQYKKGKQKIIIAIGVIACCCLFNFNYVTSFAKGIFKRTGIILIESKAEENSDLDPEVDSIWSEETESASELKDEENVDEKSQKDWVRFKLEYPEGYPEINADEFKSLYDSILYKNQDDLEEIIKSEIAVWVNSCTVNAALDNAVTSQGKSAGYYSEIEANFSNENGKLLSSDLLDEIIEGRGELMELYPNGTLAWLLANHNQTYALNYLYQTNEENSILYFYMQSIYHTQKSLGFNMSIESKNERINYIKLRYKDISDCKILDDYTRLRALEIYVAMESVLN